MGSGFDHTAELHVIKFKRAVKSADKDHWQKAMGEEHEWMRKHKLWEALKERMCKQVMTIS